MKNNDMQNQKPRAQYVDSPLSRNFTLNSNNNRNYILTLFQIRASPRVY